MHFSLVILFIAFASVAKCNRYVDSSVAYSLDEPYYIYEDDDGVTIQPVDDDMVAVSLSPSAAATDAEVVSSAPTAAATDAEAVSSAPTASATDAEMVSSAPTAAATDAEVVSSAPTSAATDAEVVSSAPTAAATDADDVDISTSSPTLAPSISSTLSSTVSATEDESGSTSAPTATSTVSSSSSPTAVVEDDYYNFEETDAPSASSDTGFPSLSPTFFESAPPTHQEGVPTDLPTAPPTFRPTPAPTQYPTRRPTLRPTNYPTELPTAAPTYYPTVRPTRMWKSKSPTIRPTRRPSPSPTQIEIILSDKEIFGFDVGSRAANIMTLVAMVLVIIWLALSTAYCITRGYNNPRYGRARPPSRRSRREQLEQYWSEVDESTSSVTPMNPGDGAPPGGMSDLPPAPDIESGESPTLSAEGEVVAPLHSSSSPSTAAANSPAADQQALSNTTAQEAAPPSVVASSPEAPANEDSEFVATFPPSSPTGEGADRNTQEDKKESTN